MPAAALNISPVEMTGRAGAGGAVVELARHSFGERDQIGKVAHRLRRMHDDRHRRARDQRDRREVAHGIIRQIGVERGIDGVRADGAISSVWPSGADFATASAPIEPPAPPRLSTTRSP